MPLGAYKTFRIQGILLGEQRSTAEGQLRVSEDLLDKCMCDDGWGVVGLLSHCEIPHRFFIFDMTTLKVA